MGVWVYVIVGVLVAGLLGVGVQQVRIASLHHDVTQARADERAAEEALSAYQAAASSELARRLLENQTLETRRQKELDDARQSYQHRIDVINARWVRAAPAAPAGHIGTVPTATVPGPRAVDAAADGDRLPLCVRSDRGPELEALLKEADINTAKLLECQSQVGRK